MQKMQQQPIIEGWADTFTTERITVVFPDQQRDRSPDEVLVVMVFPNGARRTVKVPGYFMETDPFAGEVKV